MFTSIRWELLHQYFTYSMKIDNLEVAEKTERENIDKLEYGEELDRAPITDSSGPKAQLKFSSKKIALLKDQLSAQTLIGGIRYQKSFKQTDSRKCRLQNAKLSREYGIRERRLTFR